MLWQVRRGLIAGRGALDPAVAAAAMTTWDAGTVSAVTLSGGDLIATNTGTTSTNQGAHAPSSAGKTSGKRYFEFTFTTAVSANGSDLGAGIGTTGSTFAGIGGSATTGNVIYKSGIIWANGGTSSLTINGRSSGDVIGVAVDLDNRKIWFKKVNGTPTSWNAISGGSNDPATNVGGVTIPSGTMIPFCTFGGTGGVANDVITLNAGATAFVGSVPSGFTSGWPP